MSGSDNKIRIESYNMNEGKSLTYSYPNEPVLIMTACRYETSSD